MQKISEKANGKSLLLHACCAPCSSSVLMRLSSFFRLTIFYYNPNIDTKEEYEKREEELERLISIYNDRKVSFAPINLISSPYNNEEFKTIAKGFEDCKEGGERCARCYRLRLSKTYEKAKTEGFSFFCSTLSVSPYKNASFINSIGFALNENVDTMEVLEKASFPLYLPNDFKKRNGYLDSINISKELSLYRQDYCGCEFSKRYLSSRQD
ncbi:MAG: epoxyqueuosine reductase QueH [Treponema sp.]